MKTQNVSAQAEIMRGIMMGATSSKESTSGNSFGLVMDYNMNSIKNSADITQETIGKKSYETRAERRDGAKFENRKQAQNVDTIEKADAASKTSDTTLKTTSSQNAVDSAKDKVDGIEASKRSQEANETSSDEVAMAEQAMGMLQDIRNAIMEILNLTGEELDGLLAEQGLTLGDLVDPDGLKQLILGAHGKSDVMEFLMDGELTGQLNLLTEAVGDVLHNYGDQMNVDANVEDLVRMALASAQDENNILNVAREEKPNQLQESKDKHTGSSELKQVEAQSKDGDSPLIEVIQTTETGNSKDNHDLHEDGKQATADQQFENFLQNLTGSTTETKVEYSGEAVRVVELREIASQIIEKIRVVMKPDQTSMELQLNPEHLGKVNVHVESRSGVLTAQFTVQNELAKEAIESQLQILKDTLNSQGIKVDAIEVTVASYAFEQSGDTGQEQQQEQHKTGGQKLSLEEAMNMTEAVDEANPLEEREGITGSNIDMTA